MALLCYGSQLNLWLDENAVNLVYALLSLQDNFDLENFAEKRQAALNALIAGAPRKAPQYVFTAPFFFRMKSLRPFFFSSVLSSKNSSRINIQRINDMLH